jgi:hypothetical protein
MPNSTSDDFRFPPEPTPPISFHISILNAMPFMHLFLMFSNLIDTPLLKRMLPFLRPSRPYRLSLNTPMLPAGSTTSRPTVGLLPNSQEQRRLSPHMDLLLLLAPRPPLLKPTMKTRTILISLETMMTRRRMLRKLLLLLSVLLSTMPRKH